MTFGDYTLAPDGSISTRLDHRTEALDRASVEMFHEMLDRLGDNFRKPVPANHSRDIELSWAAEGQAALAAFSLGGQMVTISALLSGREEDADERVLRYFREILAEEARPWELVAQPPDRHFGAPSCPVDSTADVPPRGDEPNRGVGGLPGCGSL